MAEPLKKKRKLKFPKKSRLRWGMLVIFFVLVALILPKDYVPEYSYDIGKPWVAPPLRAEFNFSIPKGEAELEDERQKALAEVPAVFQEIPGIRERSEETVLQTVDDFLDLLREYSDLTGVYPDSAGRVRQLIFLDGYGIDPDAFLLEQYSINGWGEAFVPKMSRLLDQIYSSGLADTSMASLGTEFIYVKTSETRMYQTDLVLEPRDLRNFAEGLKNSLGLNPTDEQVLSLVIFPELAPNLRFSEQLTEDERRRAVDQVSNVKDKIKKGDVLIGEGERVSDAHALVLSSYSREQEERFGSNPYWVTFLSQLGLSGMITLLLILFLRVNRRRLYASPRKLALTLTLFLIMIGVSVLVLKLTNFSQELRGLNYIFLAPMCMVPIILSTFFDARFAFFGTIIVSLFIGSVLPNGFEYIFVQFFGGAAAVYSILRLRNRADFFISLSLILLAYVVAYLGYNFYTKGSFLTIEYGNLVLFFLNVLLTLITYPLIYIFERVFGLTSDLTFVELLDTNHPLLKQLSVRAPGTFQHSLQVANIAEAVINKIGGNSLQVKVGALFHDIGKMENPSYFIENLGDNVSPHSELAYEESARIIVGHVTSGVKLANEYSLPAEVVDFIKTHHGTTRTEYFYRKYMEEHPDEEFDPVMFSYPGPLPFSREMSVLMIADSCEAASRSLKEKSHDNLKGLVHGIVRSKVEQNQFVRSALTFRDLEDCKQVVFNMLVSIYHGRIEYPDAPAEAATAESKPI